MRSPYGWNEERRLAEKDLCSRLGCNSGESSEEVEGRLASRLTWSLDHSL